MDYTKLKPSYTVVVQNEDGSSNSRKTSKPVDTFTGPVEKRRRTNVEFLFFFGIFVIIWFLLCLYCMVNGDLNRLHVSEDVHIDRESEQNIKDFAKDIKLCSGEIYLSCTCAVGFSALLILLFRRYANVIVWLVIGLVISVFTIITLICWGVWLSGKARTDNPHSPNAESSASFIFAIISTIVTLIVSLVIYAMRKNIRMVIILFKEGGKVVQSMPLVILQPFVTLAALIVLLFLGVYFFMVIETSGYPQTHPDTNKTVYVKDELMLFAPVYNIVTVLWISQFLIGCQHMVIAGAVATWFFSRDKSGVRNALSRSYTYLYKYHLGSVALGSLIITTVKIIRFIYRIVTRKNNGCVACMLRCVCKYLERFITFLTRNAYIEIAIYGDGFWVSGKRAFEALTNNAVKVATINSVGDFVMYMGRFVVVLCSVIVGNLLIGNNPELHSKGNPLFIIMIFAWIVVDAFMTAFEMIVDTLFICFCEDCDINDGGERPFYMSPELMVFINKDRCKVLRIGDAAVE